MSGKVPSSKKKEQTQSNVITDCISAFLLFYLCTMLTVNATKEAIFIPKNKVIPQFHRSILFIHFGFLFGIFYVFSYFQNSKKHAKSKRKMDEVIDIYRDKLRKEVQQKLIANKIKATATALAAFATEILATDNCEQRCKKIAGYIGLSDSKIQEPDSELVKYKMRQVAKFINDPEIHSRPALLNFIAILFNLPDFETFKHQRLINKQTEEVAATFYICYSSSFNQQVKKSQLIVYGDWQKVDFITYTTNGQEYHHYLQVGTIQKAPDNMVSINLSKKNGHVKDTVLFIMASSVTHHYYLSGMFLSTSDDAPNYISGGLILEKIPVQTKAGFEKVFKEKTINRAIIYDLFNTRQEFPYTPKRDLSRFTFVQYDAIIQPYYGKYELYLINADETITRASLEIKENFLSELISPQQRKYKGTVNIGEAGSLLQCQTIFGDLQVFLFIKAFFMQEAYLTGSIAGIGYDLEPFNSKVLLYKINSNETVQPKRIDIYSSEFSEVAKNHPFLLTYFTTNKKSKTIAFFETLLSARQKETEDDVSKIIHLKHK